MTDKQQRFCEEYMIDLNATQAAIRAGYSVKTAMEQGYQLLQKTSVQEKITELRAKISERNGNLAQRVIDELVKVGFSNIQDYITDGNNVQNLADIEPQRAAAVASVKKSITTFGDEDNGGIKEVVEFKLWDKISALEKIGRHLGIFEKDNSQTKPEVAQPFTDSQVDRIIANLRNEAT